jgi:hypothetical protein
MKLSEHDIDALLEVVSAIWDRNQVFRGKLRKKYFLKDMEAYLKNASSGTMENVCPSCLGTGYKSEGK